MIILDENFPENQRQLLRSWRIPVRQVGFEVGKKGLKDSEIIPLLFKLRSPTFFSLDSDFYRPKLCHMQYCLVYVDVEQYDAAFFVRRLLRHGDFNSYNKRKGKIIRISHTIISVWRLNADEEEFSIWPK